MTTIDATPRTIEPRTNDVGILGIGTATPPSVLQSQIDGLAQTFACDTDQHRSFHQRVFSRAGVNARGSVLVQNDGPADQSLQQFYHARAAPADRGPTTGARMERYAREAPPLAEAAAARALATAAIEPTSVTHLITVSCTGFVAPGMDVELIQRLGLAANVRRTHIGFMGCHAAFNALGAAGTAVRADAGAVVLICCVELCTLHFAYGWSPERLVANALFADGAAATVVGHTAGAPSDAAAHPWRLRDTASLLLPDTRSAMTWRIGDHGYEMTLSADLPKIVRSNLRPWVNAWLARHNLTIRDINSWAIHPGGPKILDAAEAALDLPGDATHFSRSVLADHGNMSSATILFVLQQMASANAEGPCVALGFGPGLMMEGLLLDR